MSHKRTTALWWSALPILLIALLTLPAEAGKYPEVRPIEVAADAPDSSVELVGFLHYPTANQTARPPLVVLLHEKMGSHKSWSQLVQALCASGYAVFAPDWRGYGLSIYDLKRKKNRPKNTFRPGDFLQYPSDLRFMLDIVFERHGAKLDTTKIAIIGGEIGANAGLIYAEGDPRVKYIALISPGIEYSGLQISEALRDYGDRPLYIATAAQDIYSSESCYLLSDLCPRVLEMDVYEGFMKGSKLVRSAPGLEGRLKVDLKRYLRGD